MAAVVAVAATAFFLLQVSAIYPPHRRPPERVHARPRLGAQGAHGGQFGGFLDCASHLARRERGGRGARARGGRGAGAGAAQQPSQGVREGGDMSVDGGQGGGGGGRGAFEAGQDCGALVRVCVVRRSRRGGACGSASSATLPTILALVVRGGRHLGQHFFEGFGQPPHIRRGSSSRRCDGRAQRAKPPPTRDGGWRWAGGGWAGGGWW